jgi:hypothetical protein
MVVTAWSDLLDHTHAWIGVTDSSKTLTESELTCFSIVKPSSLFLTHIKTLINNDHPNASHLWGSHVSVCVTYSTIPSTLNPMFLWVTSFYSLGPEAIIARFPQFISYNILEEKHSSMMIAFVFLEQLSKSGPITHTWIYHCQALSPPFFNSHQLASHDAFCLRHYWRNRQKNQQNL